MKKIFIYNPLFRVLAPPLYGLSSYVLILLIFDSINQLSGNFFSPEVFLCIIISFLLSEGLRLGVRLSSKLCKPDCNHSYRLLMQVGIGIVISVLITTLITYFYFNNLVKIPRFKIELIVFNLIYLLAAILYHLVYFSLYFLFKLNKSKIREEEDTRKHLELELKSYKSKINAELLYHSFETLIGLAHKDAMVADTFISKLSNVYRSILSNKKNELITLEDELVAVIYLVDILNYKYNNSIRFDSSKIDKDKSKLIVPCTLLVLLDDIIHTTIISELHKLVVKCQTKKDMLVLRYKRNERLGLAERERTEFDALQKAFSYFSTRKIEFEESDGYITYKIPTFVFQENGE